jgi:pilus assembly protein CpaE
MEKSPDVRPIPRISIQAFCDDPKTMEAVEIASADRRLEKAHVKINSGGAYAAITNFCDNPTPNLLVIESKLQRLEMLDAFDLLAERCDAGTRVLAIAHHNDDVLRRELLERGVSDVLVAPVEPMLLMESIANIYHCNPVGRGIAFIGTKGGVGSSTICHNVSWSISNSLKTEVVIADFDMGFGTARNAFNQEPDEGIYDALANPERDDKYLLDRLLTRCSEHLSLLAAPTALERGYDLLVLDCN